MVKLQFCKGFLWIICFTWFCFSVFAQQNVETAGVNVDVASQRLRQLALSNPEYVVCAGDVYNLSYNAGGQAISYTIQLDTSYILKVSNLATINVAGRKFTQVKKSVEDIVIKNYPFSGAQFTLVTPAQFTVLIQGEVVAVSEVTAWGGQRLSEFVNTVATAYSSKRNVDVKSADGTLAQYDLFQAQRYGDMSQDPFLRPGDTVILQRYDRKVTISGAVERPGEYEVSLTRMTEKEWGESEDTNSIGQILYLKKNEIQVDGKFVLCLENRDIITISSKLSQQPVLFVEGAVSKNTEFAETEEAEKERSNRISVSFTEGTDYATVVRRYADIFTHNADLQNAYILRAGESLQLNIESILYDEEYLSGILAMRNDTLMVPFRLTASVDETNSFLVTVKGEVTSVQEKTALWGRTRLSSVIQDCLTPYSSTRNIEVYSADGSSVIYDLFQAQRYGDMSQDPFLRPGDIVVIKRYDRRVTISGAVERPGEYELIEGENLEELINYYGGGLTEFADMDTISVFRLSVPGKHPSDSGDYIYLNYEDIYVRNRFKYVLYDHDTVFIDSVLRLKPIIFMEGAVKQTEADTAAEVVDEAASQKTVVVFKNGEDYGDIMRRISNSFSSASDLKNAYIIRDDGIVPLNIEELIYHRIEKSGITAQPFDTVVVPFRLYYVTVAGAVNAPGRFPYVPDRTWEYYIGLAGGFNEQNGMEAISIQGPDGVKLSKKDVILPETTITAERFCITLTVLLFLLQHCYQLQVRF